MGKNKFKYIGLLLIPLTVSSCGLFGSSTSISFDQDSYTLTGLEEFEIKIYDKSNNLLDESLYTVTASNESIVSIKNNVVSALNVAGTTTLTATYTEDTSITATCTVTVNYVKLIESITPADTIHIDLTKDVDTASFSYTYSPTDAEGTINVYIEDESIATLTGLTITGLKSGQTRIVYETTDYNNVITEYTTVNVYDEEDYYITTTTNMVEEITYKEIKESNGEGGIPSTTQGDANNILVIPINFSNSTFQTNYGLSNDAVVTRLNTVFNGDGYSDTGYWESVSSYYYKSSNGKLSLNFDIGDVYTPTSITTTNISSVVDVLVEAINSYVSSGFEFDKYDNDDDGEIDGIWFVHSNTAYQTTPYFYSYVNYTTRSTNIPSSSAQFNGYAWASFYTLTGQSTTSNGFDTHTIIHETGHLLGLDDYYDSTYTRSPLGFYDMQSNNMGDHNTWSKTALGWVEPYLYDESDFYLDTAYVTISKDQPLFLTNEYHDSAFDEFIVFEFYSPDGLNEYDVNNAWINSWGSMPNATGVKVLHVDARLRSRLTFSFVYSDYRSQLDNVTNYLYIAANNTPDNSRSGFDEISMISSNTNGGAFLSSFTGWTASDLFYAGDAFDLDTYKVNTANNDGLLNNGSSLDVKVEIVEVGTDYANLKITKTNS